MKPFLYTILLVISLSIKAQEYHFSNYSSNIILYNPSYAVIFDKPVISINYRNQWPGMEGAFSSYGLFYLQPLPTLKSSLGVKLLHDKVGNHFSKSYVNLAYTYHFLLNKKLFIALGLQSAYVFRNFQHEGLIFESDFPSNINYEKYKGDYLDFSFGLSTVFNKIFVTGLSVNHLIKPLGFENIKDNLPIGLTFYWKGKFYATNQYKKNAIFFVPAIFTQLSGKNYFNEVLYGTTLGVPSISFGLWLRQNIPVFDSRGLFDAFILSFEISRPSYNFQYSYDVNLKRAAIFSTKLNAHEVTFLLKLQYKNNRKKNKAIKCPNI